MKHRWKVVSKTAATALDSPKRACQNCKKEQTQELTHSWGRIIGRRWVPKVGHCRYPGQGG